MTDILAMRLRELRIQSKFTQAYVAEKLSISREAYSFYENGRRQPSVEILIMLADLYAVSLDYILGRTSNSAPFFDIPSDFNQLILMYSSLSPSAQKLIMRIVKYEYEQQKKPGDCPDLRFN